MMDVCHARFKWFIDMHDGTSPRLSTELASRLCPNKQSWRDYMVEHLSVPLEQPMMIECCKTQELFST
jgi:hypothetical protein